MPCKLYDRVGVTTATTGTGTVTLGAAISNAYFSFAAAGVQDGDTVRYVIDDGNDFEIGEGIYTAAGATLTRATIRSNIAGVQGTSNLTLSGSATVRIDCSRVDLVVATLLGQALGTGMINGTVVPSVGSGALTLAIKTLAGADPTPLDPVLFVFRNSTLATGNYIVDILESALSIIVPSPATLGHVSGRDQQIILSAMENNGSVALAVSCKLFDQSVRQLPTTVLNTSSNDPKTAYTSSVSNKAWLPVARCVSNQTVAGTWAAVPTQIDLAPFTLPINACRIYLNNNQSVTNAVLTKGAYDTVDFDTDSIADVATNHRIQPKVPGTYIVSGNLYATSAGINELAIHIKKNGVLVMTGDAAAANSEIDAGVSTMLQMNGTSDYLEVFGITINAMTPIFNAGINYTTLSCVRVGP
jgi:hypothetical protein